jgi:hypothetical protein
MSKTAQDLQATLASLICAGGAETVGGKFGLAVAVACFLAQTIIWFAEMSAKVRPLPPRNKVAPLWCSLGCRSESDGRIHQ